MSESPYAQVPPASPVSAPPGSSAGKGLWVSGIVCIVAGLVLGALSFALLVSGAVGAAMDQLTAPMVDASEGASIHLDAGSYTVFRQQDGMPVDASQVRVVGPDGSSVPVDPVAGNETFARQGMDFEAFASFDATTSGAYRITTQEAAGAPLQSVRIVVAPSAIAAVTDRAGWGFGILAGGLLVVLGIVLLAVGLSQRRRSRLAVAGTYGQPVYGGPTTYPGQQAYPAQQYAPQAYAAQPTTPLPAAGWYPDPDPSRPGGRRYWDGSSWTGHTA